MVGEVIEHPLFTRRLAQLVDEETYRRLQTEEQKAVLRALGQQLKAAALRYRTRR